MKLFVWANPYPVSYGNSMVFAVAENLADAKKQARRGKAYWYSEYAQDHIPKARLGKPTRVVELPCAEWHEWQE